MVPNLYDTMDRLKNVTDHLNFRPYFSGQIRWRQNRLLTAKPRRDIIDRKILKNPNTLLYTSEHFACVR